MNEETSRLGREGHSWQSPCFQTDEQDTCGERQVIQCLFIRQAFIEHLVCARHSAWGIQHGARPTKPLPVWNSQSDGGDRVLTRKQANRQGHSRCISAVKEIRRGMRSEATLSRSWEEGARLTGQLVEGPETEKNLSDRN